MNQQLQKYFLNLLAGKDYSKKELLIKAYNKGYEEEEVEEVILYMIQKRFVDDKRLAENIVCKYQSTKGSAWIRQKLNQRYISETIVEESLKDLKETVGSDIKRKLEKKYGINDWSKLDFKTKQKVLGFLSRQGFSNPYEIINEWEV
jgi:regulatory protein